MTQTTVSYKTRQIIYWVVVDSLIFIAITVFFSLLLGFATYLFILGMILAVVGGFVGLYWSASTFTYWARYGVWDWMTFWTEADAKRAARGDFGEGFDEDFE